MSGRIFSKVSHAIWESRRVRSCSTDAKVLLFYLLTNGHVTSAGVYRLPIGYASADLGWSEEQVGAELRGLVDKELIDHDPVTEEVLIHRWFKHNPPMNEKHAKGTSRFLAAVESERLRVAAMDAYRAFDGIRADWQAKESAKDMQRRLQSEGVISSDRLVAALDRRHSVRK